MTNLTVVVAFAVLFAHGALHVASAAEESCTDLADDAHLQEQLLSSSSQQFANATTRIVSEITCEYGCWDSEDEACHAGLNYNGCAEIYGHVEWAKKCDCVVTTYSVQQVCEWGCMDNVNQVCLNYTTQNNCSGVDLNWTSMCNCRDVEDILGSSQIGSGSTDGAEVQVDMWFSVPAFVVLFRESLEVVIVLAIILQFLNKARQSKEITDAVFRRLKWEVYIGASAGFCACLVLGSGFIFLASFARNLFKCDGLIIFDGIVMMITATVLSFLALNFYKMIHTKECHDLKMQIELDATIDAVNADQQGVETGFQKKHAFLIFAFFTGLREGLESIIFLIGVVSDFKDPSYIKSLPIPMVTALVLSRIAGCIFFQGTKKMRVDHFMIFCAVLLLFIAAGFFSSSMHKWQELGAFGTWSPRAERPWQNDMIFDASECCNDKTNRFFVLMRALFGWQDQPTPMELFAYILYWIIVPAIGFVMVKKAKKGIAKRLEELRRQRDARLKRTEGGAVTESGAVTEGKDTAQEGEAPADDKNNNDVQGQQEFQM
mmetsp:Transcript_9750/g.24556  ORF Transcript_9750/g.24556 Transcript_9750/m.24556 type:complete len:545 (+) Transcript_9750:135-1769(+)